MSSSPTVKEQVTAGELAEFLDSRQQRRRLLPIAIGVGVLSGSITLLFRWLLSLGDSLRTRLIEWSWQAPMVGWLLPIVWAITGATLAVWLTRRYAPEASGSGIPHIEAVLYRLRDLRWRRIIPVKIIGGVLAIGGGLALGREGPSVQIGGALGGGMAELLRSGPRERLTLIAAGSGAGLAAAFNAPLAGLVFVLEELQRDFRPSVFGAAFVAAVVANVITRLFTGQLPVFAIPDYPIQPLSTLPVFIVLGIVCGVAGVVFNKVLLAMLEGVARLRPRQKLVYTMLTGLCVGLVGWWYPTLIGGGHHFTEDVLRGQIDLTLLPILLAIRFALTMLSYATGAPGGIFAPLLILGALIGYGVGETAHHIAPFLAPQAEVVGVVGMAALFTGIVRAPLTGIVLIAEMTGNYNQLLPLLLACFFAYAVAEVLRDRPIYEALLRRDLRHTPSAHVLEEPVVVELTVAPEAPFVGRTIRELGLPPGCIIVRCRDGNREWIATAYTRIEPHMQLTVLVSPSAAHGLAMLQSGCSAPDRSTH
ncbi:MAG: voltage gated Cl- channel protein [Chloroflexus sp.]|uniref:H(+)/Cl(-) exchange transporter ClcA n=1 Tax=Chloroflexus sp. TaxID=1904827 RepID=UPI0021DD1163|nr:H(+)/Cl(-) exchange transporter ClcA [Chloroflexus sp.]GIV89962.1 MAG: voltage gated Cl- channel protein [Chloroflexus sp.]GIV89967.1 MAG: voltage gated Cl- channel protein [Chloroflexus sp.]